MRFRRALLRTTASLFVLLATCVFLPAVAQPDPPASAPGEAAPGTTGPPPTAIPPPKASTSVAIVQAKTGDSLTATIDVAVTRLALPLTIEENSGGVAKGVEIRVEPLLHERGTSSPLAFEPAQGVTLPRDLGPGEAISGTLTAELPLPGEYTSSLRLLFNGPVQKRFTVTITRAQAAAQTPLPLDVGELPDIMLRVPSCGRSTVDITTTLAPSGAKGLTLAAPALRSLTAKVGDVSLGVDGVTMTVTDDENQGIAFPLKLEPGQSPALHLRIRGIDGAGRYDAKLRFAAPGHTPLDETVAIYAREGPGVAWLWIFLGVLASFLVRLWYTTTRPKLLVERRVALLQSEVDAVESEARLDRQVLAVAAEMRAQITAVWTRVTIDEKWTDTAAIDLLANKVALLHGWVRERSSAARAKPPSIGGAVEADLDSIAKVLRDPHADAAAIAAQEAVRAGIPMKLRDAAIAEIESRAEVLSAQLDELAKNRPALAGTIDLKVRPALAEVTTHLNGDAFEAALASLENARKQLAAVLAQTLLDELKQPAPERIDQPTWDGLKARLTPRLEDIGSAATADEAMRRFAGALGAYARALAASMTRAAKEELETTQSTSRKEALTALLSLLGGIEAKLVCGKTFEAWHDVTSAHTTLTEFDPRTQSPMGAGATAPSRPIAYVSGEAAMEGVELRLPAGVLPPRPVTDVTWALTFGDVLATLAALVIASALGLGTLWKPSLSWGGWGDHLTALLWGLGLHTFSYDGLTKLFDKLK